MTTVWIVDMEMQPSNVICSTKALALSYVAEQINGAPMLSKREYNAGNLVEITYQEPRFGKRLNVSVYGTTLDPHVKHEEIRTNE